MLVFFFFVSFGDALSNDMADAPGRGRRLVNAIASRGIFRAPIQKLPVDSIAEEVDSNLWKRLDRREQKSANASASSKTSCTTDKIVDERKRM